MATPGIKDESGPPLPMGKHADWAGWAVLVIVLLFGLYCCHYALDLFDSGLYLSMGWRYTQGDLPFRDETFPAHFDLFYWILFTAAPKTPILYIRFLGVLLEVGVLALWLVLLKRYAPAPLVALALATGAYASAAGLWTPGYDAMGTRFFHAGLVLWLLSCGVTSRGRATCLAMISAGFFLAAMACHPAMPAGIAMPCCAAALGWRRRHSEPWTYGSLVCASVTLGAVLVTAAALGWSGDLARELDSFRQSEDLAPLMVRLHMFGYGLLLCAPGIVLLTAALSLAVAGMRHPRITLRYWIITIVTPGLAVCTLFIPTKHETALLTGAYTAVFPSAEPLLRAWAPDGLEFFSQRWISMLAIAGVAAVLLHRRPDANKADRHWRFIYWNAAIAMFVVAIPHALSSAGGFRTFLFAVSPLFALSAVYLYRIAAGRQSHHDSRQPNLLAILPLALLCSVYIYFQCDDRAHRFYGEERSDTLDTTPKHSLLHGIYTTADRAHMVDAVLDDLEQRLKPGEYFLEFGAGPIFYYLTRTRPALAKTWCVPSYSDARQQYLLDKMIETGRLPAYCLTCTTPPSYFGYPEIAAWETNQESGASPIGRYIHDHYNALKTVGTMKIWMQKDGMPSGGTQQNTDKLSATDGPPTK